MSAIKWFRSQACNGTFWSPTARDNKHKTHQWKRKNQRIIKHTNGTESHFTECIRLATRKKFPSLLEPRCRWQRPTESDFKIFGEFIKYNMYSIRHSNRNPAINYRKSAARQTKGLRVLTDSISPFCVFKCSHPSTSKIDKIVNWHVRLKFVGLSCWCCPMRRFETISWWIKSSDVRTNTSDALWETVISFINFQIKVFKWRLFVECW